MSHAPSIHLALGAFDGVHLGHRAVLHSARAAARQAHGSVGVMTYEPHPSKVLRPESAVPLILNRTQKDERLTEAGAEFIHHQEFTLQHAAMEAVDFPAWLLHHFKGLRSVHVGANFRYGQGRTGDGESLVRDAGKLGLAVHLVEPVALDGEAVSSSRVRAALRHGDLALANRMLLRPYEATGTIIDGRRLGRTIGFPTLNLPWNPELRPAFGVYAVELVNADGLAEPAVANWGLRPTVESGPVEPLLETHILRASGPIPTTGATVRIRWLHFLRHEQKFANLAALQAQIASDAQAAAVIHGLAGGR
jgi:riboflavin kinase/FMN adenylyltransferase